MAGDSPADFYDAFASCYHLMFENWEASMARQAAAIGSLLRNDCRLSEGARIFDCACGIGTQSLGLAKLGFRVSGSDLSAGAVERARREAAARGLDATFDVADMRKLDEVAIGKVDAVICMDNALPHLLSDDDLAQAARQVRALLRPGGSFLASIRDYDELMRERPKVQGPSFYGTEGERRIAFQVWDWHDERRYTFHLYITTETGTGWDTIHRAAIYRAVSRDDLGAIVAKCGFRNVRWLFPGESGFYQPVLIAEADGLQ